MKAFFFVQKLALLFLGAFGCAHAGASVDARVDDLLSRMTLDEKILLVGGNGMETHAIPRLGIPALKMTDGPLGVRWNETTAFPAGIALGAAFDPLLVRDVASAIGSEAKALGRDMVLGPDVNLSRTPYGGRNFESFGEDPLLTAAYARAYVKGMEKEKVLSCVKHFVLNDQEFERLTTDVSADERTLNEMYLPPFLSGVEAGAPSVMAAYNRVDGSWATENADLIRLLKQEWAFQGFLVSDWGATHSTVPAALAGLDLEMPSGDHFNDSLKAAVLAGTVPMKTLDDKIARILKAMAAYGILDEKPSDRPPFSVVGGPEHEALALKAAQESIVLLKNDGHLLPLDERRPPRIAVIGPNAAVLRQAGGGSSEVNPVRTVSPLQGLRERLGASASRLGYALGVAQEKGMDPIDPSYFRDLRGEYFGNLSLEGTPVFTRADRKIDFDWSTSSPDPRLPAGAFSVRWSGRIVPDRSGPFQLAVRTDHSIRLYLDGTMLISDSDKPSVEPPTTSPVIELEAGRSYDLRLEYAENGGWSEVRLGWVEPPVDEMAKAVDLAARSDVAVVFAGLSDEYESEGSDRANLDLPKGQVELIERVAQANPNTVVVLNSGAPLLMGGWIDHVKAVLESWYPGQEGGYAIADVLLGRVNPSGKLPVTFPKRPEDASSFHSYPGVNGEITYGEGLFVGYRHFDQGGIDPLFPFGHGLSYSDFSYDQATTLSRDLSIGSPSVDLWVKLTNPSSRAGTETVQVYVAPRTPEIERPVQELQGFVRVKVPAGDSRWAKIELGPEAFRYYDPAQHRWRIAPGTYELRIGSSSRDIRLVQEVVLREE